MKSDLTANNLSNITDTVRANVISESKCHDQLVDSSRLPDKARFNLLLAMLTQDATEFDQFYQAKNPSIRINQNLYERFHIAPKQLTGKGSRTKDLQLNQLTQQSLLASVQLQLTLAPDPLSFNFEALPSDVVNNLDVNAYERTIKKQEIPPHNSVLPDEQHRSDTVSQKESEVKLHQWFEVLHQARALETAA